jgi:hypothetical protein
MPGKKSNNTRLRNVLNSLGDNSEAIARKLRAMKISGIPCQLDACPIANVVRQELGGSIVYADQDSVDILDLNENYVASVVPPPGVISFMYDFDVGRYRFLKMPEDDMYAFQESEPGERTQDTEFPR